MGVITENEKLIRSYLAAFASGEPEAVAAHVCDDFVNEHVGVLGVGCAGKAAYQSRLAGFLSGFENLHYDPEAVTVGGDQGAARYRMHFSDNSKPVQIRGMMWFELRDHLIAKRIDCWDGLSYFKQVGADLADIAKAIGKR